MGWSQNRTESIQEQGKSLWGTIEKGGYYHSCRNKEKGYHDQGISTGKGCLDQGVSTGKGFRDQSIRTEIGCLDQGIVTVGNYSCQNIRLKESVCGLRKAEAYGKNGDVDKEQAVVAWWGVQTAINKQLS